MRQLNSNERIVGWVVRFKSIAGLTWYVDHPSPLAPSGRHIYQKRDQAKAVAMVNPYRCVSGRVVLRVVARKVRRPVRWGVWTTPPGMAQGHFLLCYRRAPYEKTAAASTVFTHFQANEWLKRLRAFDNTGTKFELRRHPRELYHRA